MQQYTLYIYTYNTTAKPSCTQVHNYIYIYMYILHIMYIYIEYKSNDFNIRTSSKLIRRLWSIYLKASAARVRVLSAVIIMTYPNGGAVSGSDKNPYRISVHHALISLPGAGWYYIIIYKYNIFYTLPRSWQLNGDKNDDYKQSEHRVRTIVSNLQIFFIIIIT